MPGSSFVCLSSCMSLKTWVGNENSYKMKCRKSCVSSLSGNRRWELFQECKAVGLLGCLITKGLTEC